MGSLRRFDISRYAREYDLPVLFETGTYKGGGVKLALKAGFEKIYSVEIVDEYFRENVDRFSANRNVTILQGESEAVLDRTLPEIEGNILFWLDAHFPGADGGLADYNSCEDERIRSPLESELEVIRKHRPKGTDVFILDDLRIYETGPFENGDLPANIDRPARSQLDFIDRLFSETHHTVKLYHDEGYVLLLPIVREPKLYVQRTLSEIIKKAFR
jgi:hypothetical protein